MKEIETRLAELEGSNRRWRRLAAIGWCVLAGLLIVGLAAPSRRDLTLNDLSAREILVQQEDSKFRIHILSGKDEARLEVLGEHDDRGLVMSVGKAGSSLKMWTSPKADSGVLINVPTEGDPSIRLSDKDGKGQSIIGPGRFEVHGREKAACLFGVVNEKPFVELTDKSGKTLWRQ